MINAEVDSLDIGKKVDGTLEFERQAHRYVFAGVMTSRMEDEESGNTGSSGDVVAQTSIS